MQTVETKTINVITNDFFIVIPPFYVRVDFVETLHSDYPPLLQKDIYDISGNPTCNRGPLWRFASNQVAAI